MTATFRPCPKPGAGRAVDRKLLTFIKQTIGRCEWPNGCTETRALHAHHIHGRGMGGGKRDDHPFGVAVLCLKHHEYAHNPNQWTHDGQMWIQRHILESRTTATWLRLLGRVEDDQ